MASRKRATAPADRVYKSSIPLKQVKFPEPVKRVKYGKQTSKRISRSDQDTLTQMDFVKLLQHIDDDDEGLDDAELLEDKPQKKRRRTGGDPPSSNSKFHTQTLTQIEHWSSTATEDREDSDVFDVLSSPRSLGLRRKKMPSDALKSAIQSASRRQSAPGNMDHPQTPRKKIAHEIPSSQSPETPLSSASPISPSRRSPLKEKSANARIHTPISPKAVSTSYTSPKLKFEDAFGTPAETRSRHAQPSPSKTSNSHKTVRFHVREDSPRNVISSPIVKKEQSQATPSQMHSTYATLKLEILDSEAESEIDDQEDEDLLPAEQSEDEYPETFYGNIGTETQTIAEGLISPHLEKSQAVGAQLREEDPGRETQVMESQRLSTQHVSSMAPRTGDSDVFISMHPQHVTNIVDQTKDHEFRRWRLPPSVSRIWMYETSPTCTLKYMAVIGPEKRPNEIKDEHGLGNAEFNAKASDSSNYAYEILELYELADPLLWAQLHANEWLKTPPPKWSWVRPAVVDRLMANLKPPLFIRYAMAEGIPASSSTDTEEAEAQLLNTMLQFTEPAIRTDSNSTHTAEKRISFEEPSLPTTRRQSSQVPHPSQASTASFNDSQSPRSQPLAEVVWESPSRPVHSSTQTFDLPTPRKQHYQGSDMILPFSLDSSQLLTKSQMLPASLLSDSVPGPPLFIQDSDDDEDL